MSNVTWLSTYRHKGGAVLIEQKQAFSSLELPVAETKKQRPVYIVWIGRRSKSTALRQQFSAAGENVPFDPHGQVRLWSSPNTRGQANPLIMIDCEMHYSRESQSKRMQSIGPEASRTIQFSGGLSADGLQRDIGVKLYSRVLAPFASVMILFTGDLGGMSGTAELIAEQVVSRVEYDLPSEARMRMIVVVPARCGPSACVALIDSVIRILQNVGDYENADAARKDLDAYISGIEVFAFDMNQTQESRTLAMREAINERLAVIQGHLRQHNRSFSTLHSQALFGRALDRFADGLSGRFSFISLARSGLGPTQDFPLHLEELLAGLPTDSQQFRIGIPLLASALVLDSLPFGMHNFPPLQVFDELYGSTCLQAICQSNLPSGVQQSFVVTLRQNFAERYTKINSTFSAVESHVKCLSELTTSMARFKSNKSCLCCIMRNPEKVLSCGHALCDTCIAIFGTKSNTEKYSYTIERCILCNESNTFGNFRFVPPTAGTRILTLDGGGIKGVIPLTFLRELEKQVASLGCPLRNFFDLVCGTSSGGLTILGVFIMQWDVRHCTQRFEQLAAAIFRRRSHGFSMFVRIQEAILSYIADCKYESAGIENALREAFGSDLRMFNPLCNDTKVAVTSTTARDSLPCLFSNYNGSHRYSVVRAQQPEHDITVSDAARCTSAAPWYFRPKVLRHLGTFQDGGLRHNNPLGIALWEQKSLWPSKGDPDFAISLGTGAVKSIVPSFVSGPFSPVRERFLYRIFKTFMTSMDGETAWNELANTIPKDSRTRLHRLNVTLKEGQIAIDEVENMGKLRRLAEDHIDSTADFAAIRDSMYASMFYFELDDLPQYTTQGIICSGNIFCRVDLSRRGRDTLYRQMFDSSAVFLVNGRPIQCIERIATCLAPYKRRIDLIVQHPTEQIGITLRNITSAPRLISGQPKTVEELVRAQMLDAPFGRPDHRRPEKPLPPTAQKRKVHMAFDTHWTLRRKRPRLT